MAAAGELKRCLARVVRVPAIARLRVLWNMLAGFRGMQRRRPSMRPTAGRWFCSQKDGTKQLRQCPLGVDVFDRRGGCDCGVFNAAHSLERATQSTSLFGAAPGGASRN